MRFSDYEQLRFERRDNGVLLITLDRPEKYNAADEQMHSELARVWADVSADPETRVAVITGAGKAFSARNQDFACREQIGSVLVTSSSHSPRHRRVWLCCVPALGLRHRTQHAQWPRCALAAALRLLRLQPPAHAGSSLE